MEEYKAKKDWRGDLTEFEGFIFKFWGRGFSERIYINDADRGSHGYIDISGWFKREIVSDESEAIRAAKDFLEVYHVKHVDIINKEQAEKVWQMYKDNKYFEEVYGSFYRLMRENEKEYGQAITDKSRMPLERIFWFLREIANYVE